MCGDALAAEPWKTKRIVDGARRGEREGSGIAVVDGAWSPAPGARACANPVSSANPRLARAAAAARAPRRARGGRGPRALGLSRANAPAPAPAATAAALYGAKGRDGSRRPARDGRRRPTEADAQRRAERGDGLAPDAHGARPARVVESVFGAVGDEAEAPLLSPLSGRRERLGRARRRGPAAAAALDPRLFGVRTVRGAASAEARGARTTSSYSGAALIAPPPPPPKAPGARAPRAAHRAARRRSGRSRAPRPSRLATRRRGAAAAAAGGGGRPQARGRVGFAHRDHPGEGRERGERRARAPPAQRTSRARAKPTAGDARLAGRYGRAHAARVSFKPVLG